MGGFGNPANETPRLKESVIKKALVDLDWPALETHLNDVGMEEIGLAFLLGHVRRASNLIMCYPSAKRETRRAKFFSALADYVRSCLSDEHAGLVAAEAAAINQIEQGYRGILSLLDGCDISRLPPETRASACITRAAHQFWLIKKDIDSMLRSRKETTWPSGPLMMTEASSPVSPDAIVCTLVEAAAITLVMEGHNNKWFDGDNHLVLPSLPDVSEADQFKSGSTELLAIFWQLWRRTEERWRFLGGSLETETAPHLPSWSPKGVEEVITYQPDDPQVFDYIANERLNDRLGMTLIEMMVETNIESKAAGIARTVPLLPEAFVTVQEAHAAVSLCETLSYDIASDQEKPGELRLVEWLRGYAVLTKIAEDRSNGGRDETNIVFALAPADLIAVLEKCGLRNGAAGTFVRAVTLGSSSRDLFDCPLIKLTDGSLMVFGPGLIGSNPARIILSQIANLGEPLSRKGKAFEADILQFLKKQGLVVDSFSVNRGGEEYEYDVVLYWGDYVFVLECKNHSLSNHHPAQAYYFGLQIHSSAKQVKRLAENLARNPEILRGRFGPEAAEKKIIPCVLNSLPYALPGQIDGVYFTDASGLKRFFQERYFHLKTPHRSNDTVQILHRTAIHSLWSGESPSADDLIQQLEDPFQLKVMLAHIRLGTRIFATGPQRAVCAHHFARDEMSIDSYADVVGVSGTAVRKEMAEIGRQVKKLRKRTNRPKD